MAIQTGATTVRLKFAPQRGHRLASAEIIAPHALPCHDTAACRRCSQAWASGGVKASAAKRSNRAASSEDAKAPLRSTTPDPADHPGPPASHSFSAFRRCASSRQGKHVPVSEGLIDHNPCDVLDRGERPKPGKARDYVPSLAELKALWAAAENEPMRDLVRLLLLVPLRRDEAAGLRWSEVDLARGRILIAADRVKNAKAHELPLTEQALVILAVRKEAADTSRSPHGNVTIPSQGMSLRPKSSTASAPVGRAEKPRRGLRRRSPAIMWPNLAAGRRISGSASGLVVYQPHHGAADQRIRRVDDHLIRRVQAG